ncbi:MAG: redoxin domain-containing protein [Anaerolineales bacterium]|nr:redoxin domain-containing protein [Anaerolineales bacterium]
MSDFWPHGAVSEKYGILRQEDGVPERAIFIVDKEGVIRYISIHDKLEQPDNDVLFAELAKVEPARSAILGARKKLEEEELPSGGVVLYCTRWCPSCHKARKWLADHKIEYVEVNVGTSGKAAEQIKKWAGGNRTTPTLDIDGTIIVGWDEDKVAEVLGV